MIIISKGFYFVESPLRRDSLFHGYENLKSYTKTSVSYTCNFFYVEEHFVEMTQTTYINF